MDFKVTCGEGRRAGDGRDGTPAATLERVARAIGKLFNAIYDINLEDRSYVRFQEGLESACREYGRRGNIEEALGVFIDEYVVPEDRQALRGFADFGTLADRLAATDIITHDCRRTGLGWARCCFVASERDGDGRATHVVLAVVDINEEKTLRQKEELASFLARHDVLTGVLNRVAFEEDVAAGLFDGAPIGLALVDVDGFKSINDEHGHGIGDQALVRVAEALSLAFRSDDRVYRLGGDEFAVVMMGCASGAWDAVCGKFEGIHRMLSCTMPEGVGVTLSAGVCFCPSGYEPWILHVADKGLYHVKDDGKAGCALVCADGSVAAAWRDDACEPVR